MQSPSRFFDDIPTELLSGMVDRRGRREASYQRMTAWESDDSGSNRGSSGGSRSQTGGYWTGRSKSAPQQWGQGSSSSGQQRPDSGSPNYWSPGGQQKAQPARKPATAAPGGQTTFKRRDSVQHATFGIGTVIESERTRDGDEQVTIAFPGVGIKKLMVSLANLKKL